MIIRFRLLAMLGFVSLAGTNPGAAATVSTHGAAPVPIAQLSVSARTTLPDATMIELKPGLNVSLGTLRAQHRNRMARFAAATQLGNQAYAVAMSADESKAKRTTHHGPKLTLLPIASATWNAVPWTGVPGSHWAPDYTAFCKAAKASICLYVPQASYALGATLAPAGGAFTDIDMLITDKGICSDEGGTLYSKGGVVLGCLFFYPNGFNVQYFAGNPPSATANTKACSSKGFTKVIDPHGGAAITLSQLYLGYPWGGSSAKTVTCAISIMVPSGQPKTLPTPVL
jgi:hypothetical protein